MPSKQELLNSDPFHLVELGLAMQKADKDFADEIGALLSVISDATVHWEGPGSDAADHHIREAQEAGRKLSVEGQETSNAMIDAGNGLMWWRESVLARIRDAESVGCVVDDGWTVRHEDAAQAQVHQNLVNDAVFEYNDATSELVRRIR